MQKGIVDFYKAKDGYRKVVFHICIYFEFLIQKQEKQRISYETGCFTIAILLS